MAKNSIDWGQVGTDVAKLAQSIFSSHAKALAKEGLAFLREIEERAIKYHLQLATKQITKSEFNELMLDLKALAKMEKLKQEGLTLVARDKFVNGAIDILMKAAISAIP
jgi:hypothetical protein